MWLATGGLLTVWWKMLSLGPRLPLDFWLWLSPACPSASGQLSFGIGSILCSNVGQPTCQGLSWESSLCFVLSLWRPLSVGCQLTVAPSGCCQGIQAWSSPQACSPRLPVQPPLAGGELKHLGYFSAGSCSQTSVFILWVFFSLPVMLPSEIPKLPTDLRVGGFPTVWKLLLMTPSQGRLSIPNSFVSLFVFYTLSYLLSKRMGCLPHCLVSFQQHSEIALWKLLNIQMIF